MPVGVGGDSGGCPGAGGGSAGLVCPGKVARLTVPS